MVLIVIVLIAVCVFATCIQIRMTLNSRLIETKAANHGAIVRLVNDYEAGVQFEISPGKTHDSYLLQFGI